MIIKKINKNKKAYLELLLLGDEQEDMIDRYLFRGDMFALYDDNLRGICVVTKEAESIYEIKNIAVYPEYQRLGYAKNMIEYILSYYKDDLKILLAGTGEVPSTVNFYKHCGFIFSHRIKNFFKDNYDHPIFEDGIQLDDMVYFKKENQYK